MLNGFYGGPLLPKVISVTAHANFVPCKYFVSRSNQLRIDMFLKNKTCPCTVRILTKILCDVTVRFVVRKDGRRI